jgi:hypothetical protein
MIRFFRCGKEDSCSFCKRGIGMTVEQKERWFGDGWKINNLWHFPRADPRRPGHFMHYKEACLLDPVPLDLPSQRMKTEIFSLPKEFRPFHSSKYVRGYIQCSSCKKPRLIYGSKSLTTKQRQDLLEDVVEFHCGAMDIQDFTSHLTTKKRSGSGKGEKENLIMFTHPGIHCAVNVESRYYKLAWESAAAKTAFLVIGNLSTDRKGAYPLCAYCGNVVGTLEMKNLVGSAEKKATPPSVLPICTTCKDVKNLPPRKASEKFSLAEEVVDPMK